MSEWREKLNVLRNELTELDRRREELVAEILQVQNEIEKPKVKCAKCEVCEDETCWETTQRAMKYETNVAILRVNMAVIESFLLILEPCFLRFFHEKQDALYPAARWQFFPFWPSRHRKINVVEKTV